MQHASKEMCKETYKKLTYIIPIAVRSCMAVPIEQKINIV